MPNALSILRIALSVALLFLTKMPWVFVSVYFASGLTDLFDGKIARRFHVESDLGSKLDGLADTMLFAMALVSVAFLAHLRIDLLRCAIPVGICAMHKGANVVFARVRFKTWNMMHTLMTKSVGAAAYFCVPVFLLIGEINFHVILGMSILSFLTFADETATLLLSEEFNVNHKGIVGEKIMAMRIIANKIKRGTP